MDLSAAVEESDRLYTIGELAAELGVTTRTIRFYESKGLISPARRGVARSYARRDRARLKLILRGKNLGFSLEEIAQYLKLYDADPAQIAQTQMLLNRVEQTKALPSVLGRAFGLSRPRSATRGAPRRGRGVRPGRLGG
jgi:DNA-binding transcriptional MerR regulator